MRADPKKTGSLAVLFLILGVVMVRQMGGGTASRPAAAAGASAGAKVDPALSVRAPAFSAGEDFALT
jgi:hypothetical protein